MFGSLSPRGRDITQFSYSITILILTFSRPSNSRYYIFWYFLSILGTIYAHFKPLFKIIFLTHLSQNCIITRPIPIIYHKINKYLKKLLWINAFTMGSQSAFAVLVSFPIGEYT